MQIPSCKAIHGFKNKNQKSIDFDATLQMYHCIVLWVTVELK